MHSCVVTKITVIMHAVTHQRSDQSDTREEQKSAAHKNGKTTTHNSVSAPDSH